MGSQTLERTVQEEQEAHDAQEAAEREAAEQEHEDEQGQPTLIDRSQYEREDLAIAKVDGNSIDRIYVGFSGGFFLDRSEPADVAFYNRLRLGHDVTLMVEGRCLGTGAKGATNREGQLDVVVGEKKVKIHTGYVPAAEDLEAELARTAANHEPDEDESAAEAA